MKKTPQEEILDIYAAIFKDAPNKRFMTVGELKKALEDVPDELLIVKRGHSGPFLAFGLEGGTAEAMSVGSGKDKDWVFANDEHFGVNGKWKGKHGEPFPVLVLT